MADSAKSLTPLEQMSKRRYLKKEKEKEIKQAEKIIFEAQEKLRVQEEWEEKLFTKYPLDEIAILRLFMST